MVQALDGVAGASPDDFIGFTIVRVAHVLQRRMEREMLRMVGVSVRQFGALSYLAQDPGIGSAALARKLLITAQSAGPLVDDLARRGLVIRDDGAAVGKRKAIAITDAGRDVLERGYEVARRLRAEDEAGLSPSEAAFVNRALLKLLERLSG